MLCNSGDGGGGTGDDGCPNYIVCCGEGNSDGGENVGTAGGYEKLLVIIMVIQRIMK